MTLLIILLYIFSDLGFIQNRDTSLVPVILKLSPRLDRSVAKTYSDLIMFESKWYNLDPLLVSSYITVESGWKHDAINRKTNDYGLMQVHVSSKSAPRFYGEEKQLLKPRVNIREGCRILAMWKRFHRKWCNAGHPWIAHTKWGRKIPNRPNALNHSKAVLKVYDRIKDRAQIASAAFKFLSGATVTMWSEMATGLE